MKTTIETPIPVLEKLASEPCGEFGSRNVRGIRTCRQAASQPRYSIV